MKQILYDMGPLTLVRIQAEKGLPTQKVKKISVSYNDL